MKRRTPKLGQHFLKNPLYAKRLAEAVRVRRGEALLEIGPGEGVLTRELLATGAHVIAVEKDATLVKKLQETFAQEIESGQFTLIEDDVRNFNPRSLKLEARSYAMAANIQYYITGEILRMFLSAEEKPRICPRKIGSRKVPPNRLAPEMKVMMIPRVKLRSRNGVSDTIGCR